MVQCKNLQYIYKGSNEGLKDLSVTLKPKNIYGLLGKNGSGKTTMLRIISSLLFSQRGECIIKDIPVKKRYASVLKYFYHLPEDIFNLSVSGKKFIHYYASFYPGFDREYFHSLATELNITDTLTRSLNKVSLGQRKKLYVAFSLATKTQVLLLDEPTNGLDIPSRTALKNVMYKSVQDSDRVILISTHNIRDIENLVTSYIYVDEGRHLFSISTETIYRHFSLERHEEPHKDNALYTCSILGGYASLLENKTKKAEEFDLEIFFTFALNEQSLQHALASLETVVDEDIAL